MFDVTLSEEPQPCPARDGRAKLPVRDDLEFLWLMVRGSMQRRRTEEAHVVRLSGKIHERIDVPSRRRCPNPSVLNRHDDEKTTTRNGKPSLDDEPLNRLL
jgi:hypothetical protein